MTMPDPISPVTNARTPSCPLETLNADCLITILSLVPTLPDLASFIHASPVLFHAYLVGKPTILRAVLTLELGPAVRDALVLSFTEGLDMRSAGTPEQTLDVAVGAYRECRLMDGPPWVRGEDAATWAAMARIARVALGLAELYFAMELHVFRGAADRPPLGDWPATRTERDRIVQAVIRFQMIAGLYHPHFDKRPAPDAFFARMVGVFESWELEQVSVLSDFMGHLIPAFSELGTRQRRPSNGSPERDEDRFFKQHYYDPAALYAKLVAARQSDPEFPGKLTQRAWTAVNHHRRPLMGWLNASHQWVWDGRSAATPPPPETLALLQQPPEDAAVRLEFHRESPTRPPWAWVSAWDGRKVNRWGDNLIPGRPPGGRSTHRHHFMYHMTRNWRTLGVVFWDRERAEVLQDERCPDVVRPSWLWTYLNSGPVDVTEYAPMGEWLW